MSVQVRRWVIFALFGIAYFAVFIQRMGMGVINPDVVTTLSLSPSQMGTLGSVAFYGYAVAILFSGFLATKLGPRKTLSIFFGLGGLGALLFSSTNSYSMLLVGVALLGIGTSVVVTSATVSFSRWFTMKEFAQLMAFYFFFGGIGNFVGTGPLSWMAQNFGWRFTFSSIAILMLGIAALGALLVRDFPPPGAIVDEDAPKTTDSGPKRSMMYYLGEALKNYNFWCVIGWYVFLNAVYYCFGGIWAGAYLGESYGLTRTEFGPILMMGAFGFTFGGPILTWLSNKVFKSYRMGILLSNVICTAGIAMLVLNIDGLSRPMLYVMMLMIGMASAPSALIYATVRKVFGAHMSGALAGVWSFVLFTSGGIMSMVIGSMVTNAKAAGVVGGAAYQSAFYIFLVCAIIGTIAGMLLKDGYTKPE